MDDVEGIGFSDSEKEDEKPIVAEVTKNTVAENSSISLPMTEASEAWMDDIGEADFSESEGEEEQKNPMTEASDAWMDDTGEAEFLDSDEEEETINTDAKE